MNEFSIFAPSGLVSFHGDPALKSAMLQQITLHEKADKIVQGIYWEEGRGCAVGCSINSLMLLSGKQFEHDNHEVYATQLGIPESLARLEDSIFEGLAISDAKAWPRQFLEAIPVGVDLAPVVPQFMLWILADEKDGVLQYAKDDRTRTAIEGVIALYMRQLNGQTVSIDEWEAAAYAASAAANAANAPYAAAYAAYAANAAANAAACAAANAAAIAGAYAAGNARKSHFKKISEKLISLLRESANSTAVITDAFSSEIVIAEVN